MQRWFWLFFLVAGLVMGINVVIDGGLWLGVTLALCGVLLAWWVSPWKGGRTLTHQEVTAMSDEQRAVVVYWRPGCGFCARLKATLGDAGQQARWVNIWQDADAAAFVRSVNDGNEVVPTVVMDGVPVTNPEPQLVLDRLSA